MAPTTRYGAQRSSKPDSTTKRSTRRSPKTPSSSEPAALSQDTRAKAESPAPRRSARNKDKGRPNYPYPAIEAPETPTTSFTPTLSDTTLSGTSTAPSSLPQDSPSTGKLQGTQEIIAKFHNCFPDGHERENVSGEGLLCGPRAVSRSVELQFGITAPTVEELHAYAQSDEMADIERTFTMGDENARPLNNDYSIDQLGSILQLWCKDHQQDLVLGCRMSTGLLILIDNDNTTAATGIVWIYSSSDGRATADEYTDHYEALRRPTVPGPQIGKTSSSSSKKRSFAPSTSTAENSAKKQRIKDDPGYDSSNSNSSDEDVCSDGEYFDWIDLVYSDDDDDDDDDELLSEDEEDNGESPVAIAPPTIWTDAQGLLRVGNQPPKSHADLIWSAPQSHAHAIIRSRILGNLRFTDLFFPGETKERLHGVMEKLVSHLTSTLTIAEGNDNYRQRYCDYTGHIMLWTPGPCHFSIEATYPLTMSSGRLQYHANPNVVTVMRFLNFLKRDHPVLILPTISSFLNATDKSQKDWALNAADNLCSIYRPFCLGHSHKKQFDTWSNWGNTKLREMIDTMRIGTITFKQQEQLDQYGVKKLFRVGGPKLTGKGTFCKTDPTEVYNNIKKIAAKYSIRPHEFDELCFVDSPSGTRVFYPFWHRSRELAKEVGWDWSSIFTFASERLIRLKSKCNRNGEKAGLGEKGMDRVLVVYWMTHWICDKIKAIKDSNEEAKTVEDIAWCLVDRWGLPIVPWASHTFGASFCKKQDHGIAMLFGLVSRQGVVAVDPVNDFDLSISTITIDSYATNAAMGFHSTDYWPKLLALLRTVPVQTPLWRMDDDLGKCRWASKSTTTTGITPRPPTIRFTMPLLDLNLWMSQHQEDISAYFKCPTCNAHFNSIGQWIDHTRREHSDPSAASTDQPGLPLDKPCPDQPAKDKAYWDTTLTCDQCGKACKIQADLDRHKKQVHSTERPWKCTEIGCDYAGKRNKDLTQHKKQAHSTERPFKCMETGCDFAGKTQGQLDGHKRVHSAERPFSCGSCGGRFKRKSALTKHIKLKQCVHSADRPFSCGSCGGRFKRKGALTKHIKLYCKGRIGQVGNC